MYEGDRAKFKEMFQDRMNKWTDVFNFGTLPFYWGGYEPVEGQIQYESRMNAARYLTEHGAKVKGHPLCWHTVCADWLMKYDNATILQKQLDRINRDVTAFKGMAALISTARKRRRVARSRSISMRDWLRR